jgi:hypothetical protein
MDSTKYNRKADEVARLKVGARTFDRFVAGKMIPYRKIGRVLLFDPFEVDAALAARFRVAAVGELRPSRACRAASGLAVVS